MNQRMMAGGRGLFALGRSRAKRYSEAEPKVHLRRRRGHQRRRERARRDRRLPAESLDEREILEVTDLGPPPARAAGA
jgi:hypothetical protein